MFFSVGQDHDLGDDAVVSEAVVHFDGALSFAVLGPVEGGEAKVNEGGVEGVEGVFEGEGVSGSEVLESFEERLVDHFEEVPISSFVGIGEG